MVFFLLVAWIMLLFRVIADIFRRPATWAASARPPG